MGNSGGSSGLGSSGGAIGHSRPTVSDHFKRDMTDAEMLEWMMNTTGASRAEAAEMLKQMKEFTDGNYRAIHDGDDAKAEAVIEQFLTNRNVPTYKGETFRGLYLRSRNGRSPESIIEGILNTGRWNERGVTSFSSDVHVGNTFADPFYGSGNGTGVLLRNVKNKSGVPIAHLSKHYREREVVYPASVARKGFKILGWEKRGSMYYVDVSE